MRGLVGQDEIEDMPGLRILPGFANRIEKETCEEESCKDLWRTPKKESCQEDEILVLPSPCNGGNGDTAFRCLKEGIAEILSLSSAGNKQEALCQHAFQRVRRGINRLKQSDQDSTLAWLESMMGKEKEKVLVFLLNLAQTRSIFRKQVQHCLETLLLLPAWLDVLQESSEIRDAMKSLKFEMPGGATSPLSPASPRPASPLMTPPTTPRHTPPQGGNVSSPTALQLEVLMDFPTHRNKRRSVSTFGEGWQSMPSKRKSISTSMRPQDHDFAAEEETVAVSAGARESTIGSMPTEGSQDPTKDYSITLVMTHMTNTSSALLQSCKDEVGEFWRLCSSKVCIVAFFFFFVALLLGIYLGLTVRLRIAKPPPPPPKTFKLQNVANGVQYLWFQCQRSLLSALDELEEIDARIDAGDTLGNELY